MLLMETPTSNLNDEKQGNKRNLFCTSQSSRQEYQPSNMHRKMIGLLALIIYFMLDHNKRFIMIKGAMRLMKLYKFLIPVKS